MYKCKIRLLQLLPIITIVFLNNSCNKSNSNGAPSGAPSQPGSISGIVQPPNAVLSIELDTATGAKINSMTPNSEGSFNFTTVLPGSYILKIRTTALYNTVP